MKKVLFLLAAVVAVYSMNDISKPYTFSPSELIRSSRINTNYDTAYNAINRNKDSIEVNFIRFKDLTGHDSTLKYLAVDTIRSNPNIDSLTGNIVITGAPTIAGALKVDSLNSTKGITSSARVTATDLEASDSVKSFTGTFTGTVKVDSLNSTKNITAPGAKLTNLTSGYFPYQNSNGYLANSPIYTNGNNVAIGKTSLETWGSVFKVLQIAGAGALYGNGAETNSSTIMSNNLYTDGTNAKPMYGSGSAHTTLYSQSYTGAHEWYSNSSLTADVAFTPTIRMKLDADGNLSPTGRITGTDFEASDSVKAVTGTFTGVVKVDSINSTKGITTAGRLVGTDLEVTDSVKAATGTFTGSISTDSIKFGAGNKITYLDTTFYDSLFDGTTYRARTLVRLIQIGSLITLYQNVMSGTITMSTSTTIKGIPDKFKPAVSTSPVINIFENGTNWVIGMARILSGSSYIVIQKGGTFLVPGEGGIEQCVFQWMIN